MDVSIIDARGAGGGTKLSESPLALCQQSDAPRQEKEGREGTGYLSGPT